MNPIRHSRLPAAALALLGLAALGAAPPAPASKPIADAVKRSYSKAEEAPRPDPTLDRAARALARIALTAGPKAATATDAIVREVSEAGGWDPPPRAVVVRAGPPDQAAKSIAARDDLASTPASHYGFGVADDGKLGAAVLLFADRRAHLGHFPRQVRVGDEEELTGTLVFPLHDARVFVTGPAGRATAQGAQTERRDKFEALVQFPEAGLYTVEVVAQSIKGPEVAAMIQVQAGRPGAAAPAQQVEPERQDLDKAIAQVLAALNARRARQGLKPLARSALLDSVAAAHSAEMLKLDYFAHVSPRSGDVGARLKRAGFEWQKVGENIGESASALEAHRVIESSPGHLANVLDPEFELVGLGAVRVKRGTIENVLLTEVFARPR